MSSSWRVWAGEILPGEHLGVDTETENIVEGDGPPALVVLTACGDDGVPVVCDRDNTAAFLRVHADKVWWFHNTPFDFEVIKRYLVDVAGDTKAGAIHQWLCSRVDTETIMGTDIAYRLLSLATSGQVPFRWALDYVVERELGVTVYKGNEVRMGWDAAWRIPDMTEDRLKYACLDALYTKRLATKFYSQLRKYKHNLSHRIQLGKQIALVDIERRGFGFDLSQRQRFLDAIYGEMADHAAVLAEQGYQKGKGSQATLQAKMAEFEIEVGSRLPRTATGKIQCGAKVVQEHLENLGYEDARAFPFLYSYMTYQSLSKQASFVAKLEKPRVHPRFDWLKRTGRTSCTKPNLQNLPRKPGVRECFVPSAGNVLITCDYDTLELCTLAQSCYTRFGYSRMREVINEGKDLHKEFASKFFGVPYDEVDKVKHRQFAKAPNFGFPGGLGPKTFVTWAKQTYNVRTNPDGTPFTEEDAKATREMWVDSWPEMQDHLKENARYDWTNGPFDDARINKAVALRIIGGATTGKTSGRPYSENTLHWVYHEVMPALGIVGTGFKQMRQATAETVELPTGLIRAEATYCAARNLWFQGIAAAGASIALWDSYKAQLPMVNFVHDEIILDVPKDEADVYRNRLEDIMVKAMQVVCPDVKISVESNILDRWTK